MTLNTKEYTINIPKICLIQSARVYVYVFDIYTKARTHKGAKILATKYFILRVKFHVRAIHKAIMFMTPRPLGARNVYFLYEIWAFFGSNRDTKKKKRKKT